MLAVPNERGEKSLVAYVVGSAGSEELRSYLRGQLPDYMMPAGNRRIAEVPAQRQRKDRSPGLAEARGCAGKRKRNRLHRGLRAKK